MKELELTPDDLIIPNTDEDLGNPAILEEYFRLFDGGNGDSVPPVLVAKTTPHEIRRKVDNENDLKMVKSYRRHFPHSNVDEIRRILVTHGLRVKAELIELSRTSSYYLLDGNHRTTAATLTGSPIRALQLERDSDILTIREMISEGIIRDHTRKEETVAGMIFAFEGLCGKYIGSPDGFYSIIQAESCERKLGTVRQRLERLIADEDNAITSSMKQSYLATQQ